jgi:two-component system, LuxR family, sensor kinase FixL
VDATVLRRSAIQPFFQFRLSFPCRQTVLTVLLGCAGYYIGALIGFALTFPASSVSTLWPPNAILLSSLLLVPTASWWLVFLGAFVAHVVVQLQSGVPILMILCWFISNSIEALIAAVCLRRFFNSYPEFNSLKSVAFYVAFAGFLAPFLSSFLDAAFVAIVGWKNNGYWQVWLTRFPSNVLAAITIPPFIVLCCSRGVARLRQAPKYRYVEGFLLAGTLMAVAALVFEMESPGLGSTPALLYLPLPLLLWAAVRFGSPGASTALLLVVLVSIWGVVGGRGPFVQSSPAENVFSLQIFLIAISVPITFLAGLIEERDQKTMALIESEARFRSMADAAPALIWMSGPDKVCNFCNQSWLDFTGRSLEQETGTGWAEGIHQDDVKRCLENYADSFDARKPFAMEYRLRRFDGEYRWLLANGVPRFGPEGSFLGYIGSCLDITERKRAESELQLQRQELSHLNRISAMGELAASLAHELKQPLTAILTNAQAAERFLAADATNAAEVREILQDIVNDDKRAGEVIRRMRQLVKKEEPEFVSFNVEAVIADVALLTHSDAILHNIRVSLAIDSGLPSIRGDRVELQQVLLNLLLNSFDAMTDIPANEREIQVRAKRHTQRFLIVSVRDRGVGLSRDTVNRIFEPFYSTKQNGLGMGLSISRSIIEAHGGQLWARNNSDCGATFSFTVPVEGVSYSA